MQAPISVQPEIVEESTINVISHAVQSSVFVTGIPISCAKRTIREEARIMTANDHIKLSTSR